MIWHPYDDQDIEPSYTMYLFLRILNNSVFIENHQGYAMLHGDDFSPGGPTFDLLNWVVVPV